MRAVAFGGGHGLGASLRALRRCQAALELEITAVVTVGDNGGSSGRLRAQRGALPPGDLRQALAALAAADPASTLTAELFQHRFQAPGAGAAPDALTGHTVGNLLLCGLMELLGDPVVALDHAASLVRAGGRVLPMSREPVEIEARIRGADPARPDDLVTVRGQHEVAVSPGRVESLRLDPAKPVACWEAVRAITEADWLVFGPGSWYTSVIPHLLVPELISAVIESRARRLVILNLTTELETAGLTLPAHLTALAAYAADLTVDVVLGDAGWVSEPGPVRRAAGSLGAELVLAPVATTNGGGGTAGGGAANGGAAGGSPASGGAMAAGDVRHDPAALAEALLPVLAAKSARGARGAEPPEGAVR